MPSLALTRRSSTRTPTPRHFGCPLELASLRSRSRLCIRGGLAWKVGPCWAHRRRTVAERVFALSRVCPGHELQQPERLPLQMWQYDHCLQGRQQLGDSIPSHSKLQIPEESFRSLHCVSIVSFHALQSSEGSNPTHEFHCVIEGVFSRSQVLRGHQRCSLVTSSS